MEIITREEARERGLVKYFLNDICKHGHISERYTNNGKCVECAREWTVKWRERNEDHIREYAKNYRDTHKEERAELNRQWMEKNKEYRQEYRKKYKQDNRALFYSYVAKRRASKSERTLQGYDKEILTVYEKATEMRGRGLDVHVDHIIPLHGETVSGLHVPWNLQIITSEENMIKGNRLLAEYEIEIFNK